MLKIGVWKMFCSGWKEKDLKRNVSFLKVCTLNPVSAKILRGVVCKCQSELFSITSRYPANAHETDVEFYLSVSILVLQNRHIPEE